jgi:hypothetical protein
MSKKLVDSLLFNYIRSKYIVNERLAKSLSSIAEPRWLCKGGNKLITKYDRHNNIPFLAAQMNVPFKIDSKGNTKQPCKLCEYVINQLHIDFYLKHYLSNFKSNKPNN